MAHIWAIERFTQDEWWVINFEYNRAGARETKKELCVAWVHEKFRIRKYVREEVTKCKQS